MSLFSKVKFTHLKYEIKIIKLSLVWLSSYRPADQYETHCQLFISARSTAHQVNGSPGQVTFQCHLCIIDCKRIQASLRVPGGPRRTVTECGGPHHVGCHL